MWRYKLWFIWVQETIYGREGYIFWRCLKGEVSLYFPLAEINGKCFPYTLLRPGANKGHVLCRQAVALIAVHHSLNIHPPFRIFLFIVH